MRFHPIETEICLFQKLWKKVERQRHLLRNLHQNSSNAPIYVKLKLNTKFFEILCLSSQVGYPAKLLSDTHRERKTYSKNIKIVFRTSQNVKIHQMLKIKNFYENSNFFYFCRRS